MSWWHGAELGIGLIGLLLFCLIVTGVEKTREWWKQRRKK